MSYTLKDLVTPGRMVDFVYYRDGNLWYKTDKGEIEFPVPIDDIGNATFMAKDKAILFMRYIRKHLATLAQARENNNENS